MRSGKPDPMAIEQVKDFLSYLEWEVRISVFEATYPSALNHELAEQLAFYQSKYRCCLHPVVFVHLPAGTPEALAEAYLARFGAQRRERFETQLEHIEALQSLFKHLFPDSPAEHPPSWLFLPAPRGRPNRGFDVRMLSDFFCRLRRELERREEYSAYLPHLVALEPAIKDALSTAARTSALPAP